jgi:hypothetical protein
MSLIVCITATVAIALAAWRTPSLRGTTLVGPAVWLLAALAALATLEANNRSRSESSQSAALRLVLGSLALCPAISLVGAKRPQDKPWHFIVASLWMVIALPGLQAMVLVHRETPETHPARAWFLCGLIAFSAVNSIGSRFWFCVLLAALGVVLVLAPFLPFPIPLSPDYCVPCGVLTYSSAVIAAVVVSYRSRRISSPLDQLWKDFRDRFGLLWTLRIAERINATAQSNGWNVTASLRGIVCGEMTDEQRRSFRQNLSNLLRRFVSEEWISKRLDR